MVKLQPKTGEEPAEIQVSALMAELAKRSMPLRAQASFRQQLREGKQIDGASVYKEFANITFIPFTIDDAEARVRSMIILPH
ncbi:MAG: hypothetical protein HRT61_00610 [Ekhidna sp.]|nr:hypothetical protein [Ekhidna sp.]